MGKAKTEILNAVRFCFLNFIGEKLVLGLSRGSQLGSLRAKIIPNHYQYKSPSERRVRRFGIEFQLDISQLVDWATYFELREPEQELYFRLSLPGYTVIDVGANIGTTVLRFAEAVGPRGKVVGFEPDSRNFMRCASNVRLNNFENISLEKLALGERAGTANLFCVDSRNRGMNRILPSENQGNPEQVIVSYLDKYLAENPLDRVDVIKLDVEGYELKVLSGAKETLRVHKPLLFIELSDKNLNECGSSAHELILFLYENGASVFYADSGLEVKPSSLAPGIKAEIIANFR